MSTECKYFVFEGRPYSISNGFKMAVEKRDLSDFPPSRFSTNCITVPHPREN